MSRRIRQIIESPNRSGWREGDLEEGVFRWSTEAEQESSADSQRAGQGQNRSPKVYGLEAGPKAQVHREDHQEETSYEGETYSWLFGELDSKVWSAEFLEQWTAECQWSWSPESLRNRATKSLGLISWVLERPDDDERHVAFWRALGARARSGKKLACTRLADRLSSWMLTFWGSL